MFEDPTRVLLVHNHYQQPGGEDQVFAAEGDLLESHGHQVSRFAAHNDRVAELSGAHLVQATMWNRATYQELRKLIRAERPQVAHFHNTFPLISPSAYYAARKEAVPVIQTLHNYRLLCPNALFFRDGGPCEDCLGKAVPWPGVVHACYRDDRRTSAVVAGMLTAHRAMGTWRRMVDVYIALTDFARQKFIQGSLPSEKVVVKPNFLYPEPGVGYGRGRYMLFVGRLSREKGVDTLLAAWKRLRVRVPLIVVGEGPLAPEVAKAAKRLPDMRLAGKVPRERVLELMKDARALLFPSVWYEGFPMVIVEAFAVGLPVIAGDLGSMSSLIDHRRTGLLFRSGDPEDLVARVEWAVRHPAEVTTMRAAARAEFETNYTAEKNYSMLLNIYKLAMDKRASVLPA